MQERDFEEISRFLTSVSKPSLYDYLEVGEDAPVPTVEEALRRKRTWAQGQQANPKYRAEALWVIKNQRLLRGALVEHPDLYQQQVRSRDEARSLEILTLFIRGTLASGTLSDAGQQAILEQGANLGLREETIRARLDELAREHGVSRPGDDGFVDHYETLGIEPTASEEEIDQAYRARYRWARNLADKRKARDAYTRLDAALRDLKDPARRAEYDARYSEVRGRPAGAPSADAQAFLPPPPEPAFRPEPAVRAEPTHSSHPSVHPSMASASGPRLAPARMDRAEQTAPPGTAPPVRRGGPDDPATHDSARPAPAAGRPPPPQRIRGKTLKLESAGGVDGQVEGTHLRLRSPASVAVGVGRRPQAVQIELEQIGGGAVTARVLSDRNWVTVEPARLGPEPGPKVVTATIHPGRMPKSRGSSVVTIVPSHGPRLAVTLDVEQARSVPVAAIGIGAVLVGAAALSAGWLLLRAPGGAPAPRALAVRPDPATAVVQVGDTLITEGAVTWDESRLPEGPLAVKVSLDGFAAFEQTVVVPPGDTVLLEPRLELSDPLLFVPSDTEEGADLDGAAVRGVIDAHAELVTPCFAATAQRALRVRAFVNGAGKLRGLHAVDPPEDLDPALLPCLGRGLRAMTFPVTTPADYWTFETTLRGEG